MSIRGTAAGAMLAASVAAGCGVGPEISVQTPSGEARLSAEVQLIPPTVTYALIDSCAQVNPYYGPYDADRTVAKKLGVAVSHDTDIVRPLLKPEKAAELEKGLEDIYQADFVFPETAGSDGELKYEAASTNKEIIREVKSDVLQQATEVLSLLPTEMVQDTEFNRYVFVPKLTSPARIDRDVEGPQKVGGAYSQDSNTIYVSYGDQGADVFVQTEETLLHELFHAVDTKVTCSDDDDNVDKTFAGNTIYLHYKQRHEDLDQRLFGITPQRQFYSDHSAENVMEDRATTGASLFYGRGLMQVGDNDYTSDFGRKQEVYLDRLDEMTPGIRASVEERTPYLRDKQSNELNRKG